MKYSFRNNPSIFSPPTRHDELLEVNGVYADMWQQQLQAEEVDNGANGTTQDDPK